MRSAPQKTLLSLAIGLACAVIAALAIRDATFRYLDSPAFRERLERAGSKKLQLNTAISHPIQREGTRLFASSILLENDGHPWLKSVQASGVSVSLSLRQLLAGAWEIKDTRCGKIVIDIESPASADAAPHAAHPDPVPFPASLLPSRTIWENARADSATIRWKGLLIERSALSLRKEGVNWNIELSGGEARFGFLPPLQIRTASLATAPDGTMFIKHAEFHSPKGGVIRVSGSASPHSTKLDAVIQTLPLEEILPPTWHSRIHGSLTSTLTAELNSSSPPSLKGQVSLAKASIEGFPFLAALDQLIGSSKFRLVPLETAQAKLEWTPQTWSLSAIELDSHRVLKIQGDARVAQDTLAFKGRLGVAVPTLSFLPDLKLKVFGAPADGHFWIPLDLQSDTTALLDSSASAIPSPNPPSNDAPLNEPVQHLKKKAAGLFEMLGEGVKKLPNLIAPQSDTPSSPSKSPSENR